MAGTVDERLRALGIAVPTPAAAAANYVPFLISGSLIFVAGQLPMEAGKVRYTGKLGGPISVEDGQKAARLCALNIIAQVKAAAGGNLDRVRAVRLGGFVNATPDFADHPKVVNGASDLIGQVFEDRGRHARAAVGAGSLPFDASVEVEAIFELI